MNLMFRVNDIVARCMLVVMAVRSSVSMLCVQLLGAFRTAHRMLTKWHHGRHYTLQWQAKKYQHED